jgi:hypothetical protein
MPVMAANVPDVDCDMLEQRIRSNVASLLRSALDDARPGMLAAAVRPCSVCLGTQDACRFGNCWIPD